MRILARAKIAEMIPEDGFYVGCEQRIAAYRYFRRT